MKNNLIMMVVIAVLVALVAGFFSGIKFQESKVSNRDANGGQFQNRRGGGNGQGRLGNGFRPVMGEILSMDDKSITVKMQDGSSKIVLLPDSVTISKTDTAAKSDLKVGEKVGVFGTDNSDGSVTAQNIQLNPMFRGPSPSTK